MHRAVLAALFLATVAPRAAAVFDPESLDHRAAAPPVRFGVLGTPHLTHTPDSFRPAMLAPLLDRLEGFAPTHIAVETVSAEHTRFLERESARYQGVAAQFASTHRKLMDAAGTDAAISPIEAQIRAGELLADGIDGSAERRRAASLLARAGDPFSALVQWRALEAGQRIPGDGVSPALASALDELAESRNEIVSIGVALAGRLGHETLIAMDDWTAGDTFNDIAPALQETIPRDPVLSKLLDDPAFKAMQRSAGRLQSAGDVLPVYGDINKSASQADAADLEWGAFIAAPSDPSAARARIAVWESRNLRMTANIHEAVAGRPGARVLVIVGASHKPYLEAYLDRLSAVEIVPMDDLLADDDSSADQ